MDYNGEIHIILAEDHEAARCALVNVLNRLFHKNFPNNKVVIHDYENGLTALQKIMELKGHGIDPDIILTDRQMPEMDGFELLDSWAVRTNKSVLKVMYSGMNSAEDESDFTRAQQRVKADGVLFFQKPNQLADLKQVLLEEAGTRFSTADKGHGSFTAQVEAQKSIDLTLVLPSLPYRG